MSNPILPQQFLFGEERERPEASALYDGYQFYATDTLVTYACVQGSKWIVIRNGLNRAAFAGFAASVYVSTKDTGPVSPVGGPGETVAICFNTTATPAARECLAQKGDNATTGWQLNMGDNGALRRELSGLWYGLNGDAAVPFTGTAAGVIIGVNCLVVSMSSGNVPRWCLNGSAVGTTAALGGAYVPPLAADPCTIGAAIVGADFAASQQVVALKSWGVVLSDQDIQRIARTGQQNCSIPDGQNGPVVVDLAAVRQLIGVTAFREYRGAGATRWYCTGAVDVVQLP